MSEEVVEEVVNKADLYSKIKEVHITNFMSFERATVAFTDEGIVGIRGYNDSGKSAVLRAIACCLLYRYSTNHKNFIQDGKNFFQVDVVFDDGITIRYEKHYTGSSLYEMYENDDLLYTNKAQNGSGFYEKIIGVPEEIAHYLGMSNTEEGISLNYGLNTDKQLLVSTSGSENYRALNQVLRSQDLGLASQLINRDNNALGGSISRAEAMITMKSRELRVYDDLEEELIPRMETYAKHVSKCERIESGLSTLTGLIDGLKEEVAPELPSIDAKSIARVGAVEKLLNEVDALNTKVAPKIPLIADEKIELLDKINRLSRMLKPLQETVAPEIPYVKGIERFSSLVTLSKAVDVIRQYEKVVEDCEVTSREAKAESLELTKELTEAGHKVVTCNNCGELTLA